MARLDETLRRSVADHTELVWIEVERGRVGQRQRHLEPTLQRERTITIRVQEGERLGRYSTGSGEEAHLHAGVRRALAHARIAEKQRGFRLTVEGVPEAPAAPELYDRQIARLDLDDAQQILQAHAQRQESARLSWATAHVVVANSAGLRQRASVTYAALDVVSGTLPERGSASGAARRLDALQPGVVFERARARRAASSPTRGESGSRPGREERSPEETDLLLTPEATARLLQPLQLWTFSASSFLEGLSSIRQHLGNQVFDSKLTLRDDPDDERGLPFPFDLEGQPKRPLELIRTGVPVTPTLDRWSAHTLGLEPTGHCLDGDGLATHLVLEEGESSEEELLAVLGEGIWIGGLDDVECFDPPHARIRARATGARRIRGGELAEPLPPLVWETSLIRALCQVAGIGDRSTCSVIGDGMLGATVTPSLALEGVEGVRILD